jgi:hypothetical protein
MKLKLNEKLDKYVRKPILLHDLEKFSTSAHDSCFRLSVEFSGLINQNVTLIEIRKKLEYLGAKLKTHVSKISPGSRAIN